MSARITGRVGYAKQDLGRGRGFPGSCTVAPFSGRRSRGFWIWTLGGISITEDQREIDTGRFAGGAWSLVGSEEPVHLS